jgi:acetoacetyl-CoA synthetase
VRLRNATRRIVSGEVLWVPSAERRRGSYMQEFLNQHRFTNYEEAWRWSVAPATFSEFWELVARDAAILWHDSPAPTTWDESTTIYSANWFPGGTLNYAEVALRSRRDGSEQAVFSYSDTRESTSLSWSELRALVSRIQAGLIALGIEKGEVVAAYLPNIPETLALMLATVGLGAVWTCCAPEMGALGAADRLSQSDPALLVTIDGYIYGDKEIDVRSNAEAVRVELPHLKGSVMLGYLRDGTHDPTWRSWDEFISQNGELIFEPVPFDHPLHIVFSSGTTGLPKAIVHSHGGILLELFKVLRYHFDLDERDRFIWYTSTGWAMWNIFTAGLLVDATVGLFDGNPNWPGPEKLWRIISTESVTCAGMGSGQIFSHMKAGIQPAQSHDLSHLLTLGATGSPLTAASGDWVYNKVKRDILLESFSGGTDICSGFVGASPVHSVWAGEISCRCLGAKVEVFDDLGASIIGIEGELVITSPMPSMPIKLLGDPDGSRYRASYFDQFPGVWTHSDRATITERGSVVITGRSDGTLNRGGVRMGTADFYSVVESLEEVVDSIVIHLEDPEGGPGELWLFVVAAPADDLSELAGRIRNELRGKFSARHVPDRILFIDSVPRTLSGKKLEVPIKRILSGADPSSTASLSSIANPESLEIFVELAGRRRNT